MHKIGLFEAKQKLSELVGRAEGGEHIGITRRGRLSAMIVPARASRDLREVLTTIESIRRSARRGSTKRMVKRLIEEGRV